MKEPLDPTSATPSKRIYLSIIADYHLNLALCELIDNAIDNWIFNGRPRELDIILRLDYERQRIVVQDNSGGIKEEDIELIVSPGQSRDEVSNEIIGVFGVGSKRAVVALAEQVKIYSRHASEKTILVELDDAWINDGENWDLPTFEVDPIEENTTRIDLSILREPLDESKHQELLEHLGATYAKFLESGGMKIIVNTDEVVPKTFDNWSYPPGYEPQEGHGPIKFEGRDEIQVSITGGLTKSHREGDSNNEEYGVYFYCNDRLVSRAYKGDEVGFNTPFKIGKPHPSLSLARVIVNLSGAVDLMPWNSSKSQIDFKHKTFREIANHIGRMFVSYATMSKNWSSQWPEQVFKYETGVIRREELSDMSSSVSIHVPVITRGPRKVKYADQILILNKDQAASKPWIRGHYEAIIAVEEIGKLKISHKNRISLLLLDSTLEIAFKDYLVNESGTAYSPSRLAGIMGNRTSVQTEIANHIRFKSGTWRLVNHLYHLRCELVHKRVSANVVDEDIQIFRELTEYILKKMLKIKFPD